MKRFVFRFEAVLKHRVVTEELRLQELARVQGEMSVCEGRIAQCRSEFDRTMVERPARIDVEDFPRREQYLDTLGVRIQQEERIHEGIAARLEDARLAVIAARQAREALERIRETDREKHRRDGLLAEQSALDEIATQRFGRSRAGVRPT